MSIRRILFTMTPAFNPYAGGVQRTTYKLGKYFSDNNFEVAYYSSANEGHTDVEYGELYHGTENGSVNNNANITKLTECLAHFKPDVVINQMPYEHPLRICLFHNKAKYNYLLLGCLRNSLFNFKNNVRDRMRQMLNPSLLPFANNFVGEWAIQKHHWIKHRKDLKLILDQHDYFILLAPPNRYELEHFVGDYKKEKVISIPNSIPSVLPEVFQKEKIILHVGRINVPQKRSDLLLEYWEKLHAELPEWRFVIVGEGEYFATLKSDLARKKLPRISLKGYQQPEPYFHKASIFMMPSAYEGFPNTLIEAQSYGCVPLVFNSYAALDWIVNDCEDALLIPPFDVEEMARSTVQIAVDEEMMSQLQTKALRNAERFTIEAVGQKWLRFFNEQLAHYA